MTPESGCLYTYTLVSHLSDILDDVERRFGPRDEAFTILGVEFGVGNPQIWFPSGRKHVAIQLGAAARLNVNEALFQVAHECVHLLNPVRAASVLEEGVATLY